MYCVVFTIVANQAYAFISEPLNFLLLNPDRRAMNHQSSRTSVYCSQQGHIDQMPVNVSDTLCNQMTMFVL